MSTKPGSKLTDEQKRAAIDKLYQGVRTNFPGVAEITAEEVIARKKNGEKFVLLDVRTPEERAVSVISGAITAEQFEADPPMKDGATVVCYCMMGGRSGMYAKHLAERGIHAMNMPGAVLAWSHAGGEFVDDKGPTKRVHTHSPDMDLLAEGYQAVC